jgi:hypothetical protein
VDPFQTAPTRSSLPCYGFAQAPICFAGRAVKVTYITKEELGALPDDPAEAFIELEAIVRRKFDADCESAPNDANGGYFFPFYHKYMSIILACGTSLRRRCS